MKDGLVLHVSVETFIFIEGLLLLPMNETEAFAQRVMLVLQRYSLHPLVNSINVCCL